METRYPPINPRFPHFLHGGDYNPEQWPSETWLEDMRLMKLANCNAMSVNIFGWSRLELEEGRFDFSWLDRVMDLLAENNAFAVLATPSGARPAWLSQKYPEVLRVRPERLRNLHGGRHNHCFTSPVYREKVGIVNRKLAERYQNHPALLVWHISNEYNGECHCDLCQAAFRQWLKQKYDHDLDALNHAWWTAFWSHTYTGWEQIESPSPAGENSLHGLKLDWKRFTTDQTIDFFKKEIAPLRELTPSVPVTTNLMGFFPGLNYQKLARELDVVSWDSYPVWHTTDSDWRLGMQIAFIHDVNRSFKGGKPFMLMESTPSNTNWQPVPKLKRPGMHMLSSLQAVAHGSDTVQYFQWRKSRGSSEKFHGAVVDHVGHEHTRVFQDVAELGAVLQKLDPVIGTTIRPEAAILFDWENRWAIEDMHALGSDIERRGYHATALSFYQPFWKRGIPVDVIAEEDDFSSYKIIAAPMMYMLKPGVAERLRQFVAHGGTLIVTYWTGLVDENDLCVLGGWPGGGLREVLGIWDEETDTLALNDRNALVAAPGNELGLSGSVPIKDYCALIHVEGARVLASYGSDFYAGRPALTVNDFGRGQAYYIAARTEEPFLDDFFGRLSARLALTRALPLPGSPKSGPSVPKIGTLFGAGALRSAKERGLSEGLPSPGCEALPSDKGCEALPEGVSAQVRSDGQRRFIFVMNFNPAPVTMALGQTAYHSLVTGQAVSGSLTLPPYGVEVLE